MKSTIFSSLIIFTIFFLACKKDEETKTETNETVTTTDTTTNSTTNNTTDTTTTDTTSNNNGGGTTLASSSQYSFSDDGITCTPYSSNPSISGQGILSVVSNPCQDPSGKLDGYFKYGNRPKSAGTYKIKNAGTGIANTFAMGTDEFQMVFYNHSSKTWYSTAGTISISINPNDSTKLDMFWKDIEMTASDSSTVKFSGTLLKL